MTEQENATTYGEDIPNDYVLTRIAGDFTVVPVQFYDEDGRPYIGTETPIPADEPVTVLSTNANPPGTSYMHSTLGEVFLAPIAGMKAEQLSGLLDGDPDEVEGELDGDDSSEAR